MRWREREKCTTSEVFLESILSVFICNAYLFYEMKPFKTSSYTSYSNLLFLKYIQFYFHFLLVSALLNVNVYFIIAKSLKKYNIKVFFFGPKHETKFRSLVFYREAEF